MAVVVIKVSAGLGFLPASGAEYQRIIVAIINPK
jgi:hypothetical protein